jgi:class 3 adenylate cyclase
MERPDTRYVDVGGAEVGYQIVGHGLPDVVYISGFGRFFAAFDSPARAVRCASAIRARVWEALWLQIRAGLHTGEVELSDEGPPGLAVDIAARVGAVAGAGEVLISRAVADLIAGSGIKLADRGEHRLKGVPGFWRLYRVVA